LAGVAGQVITAQALNAYDPAVFEELPGLLERVFAPGADLAVDLQPDLWAAVRAGDGLGVEATVQRILILGGTGRAHGERRHGGQRPIIGNVFDDGEAGAAVGAVDERIAVAAISRVKQFSQAVGTGADVG
jgi:hypothetical protein